MTVSTRHTTTERKPNGERPEAAAGWNETTTADANGELAGASGQSGPDRVGRSAEEKVYPFAQGIRGGTKDEALLIRFMRSGPGLRG
jgi:hypothetical protein